MHLPGMIRKPWLTIMVLFLFISATAGHSSVNHSYHQKPPRFGESSLPAGKRSVEEVITHLGPKAEARIKPFFERVGAVYPPFHIALIGLKEERKLELWSQGDDGAWLHIRTYEILAASGTQGPKQRQGDLQVPEGLYQLVELNPNSRFHLSMKLNYPNDYDRQKAEDENRTDLGGDIFIHGKAKSKGCIAVGDRAIEELFVLVATVGLENADIIIMPADLRGGLRSRAVTSGPPWLPELYESLAQETLKFRVGNDTLVQ
ncbi:MAG TPA: L,D-transpeptidase family protein [Thermodesulfovibrionales bacterium]|jgi:hypothetical protein|nr:L,D-transpeptidase family protein [Thermodesulfovibrionales bacterium]